MTVSCLLAFARREARPGVNSMVLFLMVAGIGLLLAGLAAIGFGIPVKEFSFGNTLIFTGTVAACTGMVMLGFGMVVRELRTIARRIAIRPPVQAGPAKASGAMATRPENDGLIGGFDHPVPEKARPAEPVAPMPAPAPAPWLEEATARDRLRPDTVAPEPAAKPRRNIMFSSTLRRERERAEERPADPSAGEFRAAPPIAPPPPRPAETPPPPPQDSWPQPERSRAPDPSPPRRSSRAPSTFAEPTAGAPAPELHPPVVEAADESLPPVTVLKSGVVDGMAYSLYSDGSIEAQMPEGMMRFASIDELRAHLDQRS
jgi:hypothetical protein